MTDPDWSRWPNFARHEFACRCGCGRADMEPGFMDLLQRVRDRFGRPMAISSGFRCPAHNRAVGGGPVHPLGLAADVRVFGAPARDLVGLAVAHGLRGIGVAQTGDPVRRFIHLDHYPSGDDEVPRPWLWSYDGR